MPSEYDPIGAESIGGIVRVLLEGNMPLPAPETPEDREARRAQEALTELRRQAAAKLAEPDRKPRSKYRPGTRIRVSYEAIVAANEDPDSGWLPVERDNGHVGDPYWYEWEAAVNIEVIPPDISPGTIITAGGVIWVARRSNKRDPLRIMPVDLSGRLRTIPIEEFFTRYQAAKIRWTPEDGAVQPDSA